MLGENLPLSLRGWLLRHLSLTWGGRIEDREVILFGEDVGIDGGVFRATEGLYQRFGSRRVRDTPLSELLISGLSVGLAAQGMRPVCEIQFTGFLYPTIDQLVNHASRIMNRTRGRLTCPMVLRAPYGGGVHDPLKKRRRYLAAG